MRARPNRWPVIRVAVAEESMLPALRPGDWLLAWRTGRVRPGQVVLAWHPQRPGFLLVKRVGVARGAGGWWLASDNPAAGAVDSARFGPVPAEKIVAVVLFRYWPSAVARRCPESSRTEACSARRASESPAPVCRGAGLCASRCITVAAVARSGGASPGGVTLRLPRPLPRPPARR